jgi:hypothetical protein
MTIQEVQTALKNRDLKKSQRRSLTDLLRRLREEQKLTRGAKSMGTFARGEDGVWRKVEEVN